MQGFCRCYIDDILIFPKTKEGHDEHLRTVFQALDEYSIALAPNKPFPGCPYGQVASPMVDAFGLATDDEKIRRSSQTNFLISLSLLETYLGMTGT